jgi:hypothetical protein
MITGERDTGDENKGIQSAVQSAPEAAMSANDASGLGGWVVLLHKPGSADKRSVEQNQYGEINRVGGDGGINDA